MTPFTLFETTGARRPAGADAAWAAVRANWQANLRALSRTQPRLAAAVAGEPPGFRPVYARDGSLTVFGPDGKWWHGCSVPLRAAEALLSTLDVKGRVACLLSPTLAAHVRVALSRSRGDQAVVAVCPGRTDLRVILCSDDFAGDIRSHRLWFVGGEDWAAELGDLFEDRSGLATPAQFIRLPTTPAEEIEPMVPVAQTVFADVNAKRCERVARRRDAWRNPPAAQPRLCVVAPSRFRLWDDGGAVLRGTLADAAGRGEGDADIVAFDPDDPACSSALALLEASGDCAAIVAADTSRAELPGVVPARMPWITWVTRAANVPPREAAAEVDGLIVVDAAARSAALAAGWPADRVSVGGWPAVACKEADAVAAPACLAVVADTHPVAVPKALHEFSSHQLLWNHIAAEVASDPFLVGDDPGGYLEGRMKDHGVGADGFDAGLFVAGLILPAYAQGLVRTLIGAGIPVKLFGAGWDRIAAFRGRTAGLVASHSDLARVRAQAAAVVDVSPGIRPDPLHRIGRPVIRPGVTARTAGEFIDAARRALRCPAPPSPLDPPITLPALLRLLDALSAASQ